MLLFKIHICFKESKLPVDIAVDTAQSDQIIGFGNFTSEMLGIDPHVCKNHVLSEC
jgi:hypothetical protein